MPITRSVSNQPIWLEGSQYLGSEVFSACAGPPDRGPAHMGQLFEGGAFDHVRGEFYCPVSLLRVYD